MVYDANDKKNNPLPAGIPAANGLFRLFANSGCPRYDSQSMASHQ